MEVLEGERQGSIQSYLDNDSWRYAVAQQLVKFGSHRHNLGRGLFSNDHISNLVAVGFPVGLRDFQVGR